MSNYPPFDSNNLLHITKQIPGRRIEYPNSRPVVTVDQESVDRYSRTNQFTQSLSKEAYVPLVPRETLPFYPATKPVRKSTNVHERFIHLPLIRCEPIVDESITHEELNLLSKSNLTCKNIVVWDAESFAPMADNFIVGIDKVHETKIVDETIKGYYPRLKAYIIAIKFDRFYNGRIVSILFEIENPEIYNNISSLFKLTSHGCGLLTAKVMLNNTAKLITYNSERSFVQTNIQIVNF